VAIFKSDAPIPDYAAAKRQNFHKPVKVVLTESKVEDDPYYSSSSDSDVSSPKRRYDLQLVSFSMSSFNNIPVCRNLGEGSDEPKVVEDVGIRNFPTPPSSQSEPVSSSGPGRRILRVPRQ